MPADIYTPPFDCVTIFRHLAAQYIQWFASTPVRLRVLLNIDWINCASKCAMGWLATYPQLCDASDVAASFNPVLLKAHASPLSGGRQSSCYPVSLRGPDFHCHLRLANVPA